MSVLIFDTETTGLPKFNDKRGYYSPKNFEMYDSGRIVEMGYRILSLETNDLRVQFNSYIHHENLDIQNSHIHGITNEHALAGCDIKEMLQILEQDFVRHDIKRIVAHNIEFDINILLSECFRYGHDSLVNLIQQCEQFCTMKRGRVFMDFYKNPKLIELYDFVHNNNGPVFKQHSAMSDCIACEKCYLAIYKS